ncbi:MAG TPA: hypothetical protein VEA36_03875 [Candidatus Paceibacterota bacterium]|nr:hypothetical protein [Candidatus Paceibacterota bacterium]
MSSIGVAAPATSAIVPAVPVVARNVIRDAGDIVSVRIPADARQGCYEGDGLVIPYFRYSPTVPGGCVHCFVHTDDESLRGRSLRAQATIMEKVLADGRRYYYVDLLPVQAEVPPTHRLVITGCALVEDGLIFATPAPIYGMIMLTAPSAKLIEFPRLPGRKPEPKAKARKPEPVRKLEAKAAQPKDTQLDRLLSQGWEIKVDWGDRVVLTKLKKGEEVEMTHHRPKKK